MSDHHPASALLRAQWKAEELALAIEESEATGTLRLPAGVGPLIGMGQTRRVFQIGEFAVKVAAPENYDVNRREAETWETAPPRLRPFLLPVLAADDQGRWLIMPLVERVTPSAGDRFCALLTGAFGETISDCWHANVGSYQGRLYVFDYPDDISELIDAEESARWSEADDQLLRDLYSDESVEAAAPVEMLPVTRPQVGGRADWKHYIGVKVIDLDAGKGRARIEAYDPREGSLKRWVDVGELSGVKPPPRVQVERLSPMGMLMIAVDLAIPDPIPGTPGPITAMVLASEMLPVTRKAPRKKAKKAGGNAASKASHGDAVGISPDPRLTPKQKLPVRHRQGRANDLMQWQEFAQGRDAMTDTNDLAQQMDTVAWEIGYEHGMHGHDPYTKLAPFEALAKSVGVNLREHFDVGFTAGKGDAPAGERLTAPEPDGQEDYYILKPADPEHNADVFATFRARPQALLGGQGNRLDPAAVLLSELVAGQRVEMEHTTDPLVSIEIALDHLAEDRWYYTKLATVHEDLPISTGRKSEQQQREEYEAQWRAKNPYGEVTFVASAFRDPWYIRVRLDGSEEEHAAWVKDEQYRSGGAAQVGDRVRVSLPWGALDAQGRLGYSDIVKVIPGTRFVPMRMHPKESRWLTAADVMERLPMGTTCVQPDGEEHVVGDIAGAMPLIQPGGSVWDPTIALRVKPLLAEKGYVLGHPIGEGTYAQVFEVEGRPDLVVKVTADANEAVAVTKVVQAGYDGLPALARFFCGYVLPAIPVVLDEVSNAVRRTYGNDPRVPLYVLVVERLLPLRGRGMGIVQGALSTHGLGFAAWVYRKTLGPKGHHVDRQQRLLINAYGALSPEDAWHDAKRHYAQLSNALPPGQDDRLEQTIAELARRGVLWSDLHGGNVMQDADGNLKIVDLGVASDVVRKQIEADLPTLRQA